VDAPRVAVTAAPTARAWRRVTASFVCDPTADTSSTDLLAAEQTTAGLALVTRLETRVRAFAFTPMAEVAAMDEDIVG
jgi:hypothetical protein